MGRAAGMMCLLSAVGGSSAEDVPTTNVGMPGRLEAVVLPGPELEAVPLAEGTPLVLRVTAVYPHGDSFRYDLEYYGLEPGSYDLTDYLRPKVIGQKRDLPPIEVLVQGVLPEGQIQPNELELDSSPWLGGYRLFLIVGGVVWVLGLFAIIFLGRNKKAVPAERTRPVTVADRLRPLVEKAMAGELSVGQQAELERSLLSFWRKRLGLEGVHPDEAMTKLRQHPEAGNLLRQLEVWLHRPARSDGENEPFDIGELLKPYHEVPDEEAR